MAARAPLIVCFLLLLAVASAVLSPPGAEAAACDQPFKLAPCEDALLGDGGPTQRCCDELDAQYQCLCQYARLPFPHYLHGLTEHAGTVLLDECHLDALSCSDDAAAAAA